MTIKAIYENGVFKPQEPVHLDEHTEIEVSIRTEVPVDAAAIGFILDAPPDMAEHHDAYLRAGRR